MMGDERESEEFMDAAGLHFRPSKHAHWRIRDVAREMGHVLYDHMMQDNQFYKIWVEKTPNMTSSQREQAFVDQNLSKLIPQARATIAQMIRDSSDDTLKEELYRALTLDATLIRGRMQ